MRSLDFFTHDAVLLRSELFANRLSCVSALLLSVHAGPLFFGRLSGQGAWDQNFSYGYQYNYSKNATYYVRPVRSFS